jgi:hypothetical protein
MRLKLAEPEPIKMLTGVEAALKMRESFINQGYKASLYVGENHNISGQPPTVAVLFITSSGFFRGMYFYEDGTYYFGSN